MKTGRSIVELAQEIENRAERKQDFIVPANEIVMTPENDFTFGERRVVVSDLAHNQISNYTKIPRGYYDRCRSNDGQPGLLALQVNHWLRKKDDQGRMLRTLDGEQPELRAFLSDMYLRVENEECLQAIMPAIYEAQHLQIKSCEVTDRNMYVTVIDPSTEVAIRSDANVNDVVSMGFTFRNSEVGLGYLETYPFMHRLVCKNGMVTNAFGREFRVKRAHRGARIASDDSFVIQSDRTRKLRLDLIISEISDAVSTYCKPGIFDKLVEQMQAAAQSERVKSPEGAVQELSKMVSLPKGSLTSIAARLESDRDLTKWGLVNAVTAEAHGASTYEENVKWQTRGGRVLDLNASQWARIAEAQLEPLAA